VQHILFFVLDSNIFFFAKDGRQNAAGWTYSGNKEKLKTWSININEIEIEIEIKRKTLAEEAVVLEQIPPSCRTWGVL